MQKEINAMSRKHDEKKRVGHMKVKSIYIKKRKRVGHMKVQVFKRERERER